MADDAIVDLHHNNVKEVIQRLHDMRHDIGTLLVVGVTDEGQIACWFAHDGDPQPYLLLGGVAEAEQVVLDWLKEQQR